jgi:hypothetical protein
MPRMRKNLTLAKGEVPEGRFGWRGRGRFDRIWQADPCVIQHSGISSRAELVGAKGDGFRKGSTHPTDETDPCHVWS